METFNGVQSQQKEVVHVCGITKYDFVTSYLNLFCCLYKFKNLFFSHQQLFKNYAKFQTNL